MVDRDWNVMMGSQRLLGFWSRDTTAMLNFGLKTYTQRNIHMTIFMKNNAIVCEVSDYVNGTKESKIPVWESTPTPVYDIEATVDSLGDELIKECDPEDEYEELDDSYIRFVDDFLVEEPRRAVNLNILPLIEGAVTGRLLTTKTFGMGRNPGLTTHGEFPEFVIPLPENQVFHMPLSLDNPILNLIPLRETLEIYAERLEDTGVFQDYQQKKLEPVFPEIQAAVLSIMSDEKLSETKPGRNNESTNRGRHL